MQTRFLFPAAFLIKINEQVNIFIKTTKKKSLALES